MEELFNPASDNLLSSAHSLVDSVFGGEFMQQDKLLNLKEIIEEVFIFI